MCIIRNLVKRQNRIIKNSPIRVLDSSPKQWLFIVEYVLFAHQVSKHASTRYVPFKLLCNREPVLPIDIKHNLDEPLDPDEPFDKGMFDAVLVS